MSEIRQKIDVLRSAVSNGWRKDFVYPYLTGYYEALVEVIYNIAPESLKKEIDHKLNSQITREKT